MSSPSTAPTASVFIAASVDGFIARGDGSIDWLNEANTRIPADEDCGYAAFMANIDALVMGWSTFEQVLSFDEWPYGDLPVIALTRRTRTRIRPERTPATVTFSDEAPEVLVQRLAEQGLRRLYIDGGVTVQRFLRARCIDTITITTIPILLGQGKSLFGELDADVALELVKSMSYPFGFVQNTYRVLRTAER
jgi:dihydrofolate reductase